MVATRRIDPAELKFALTDGAEFALLDVRERGEYARGHLFHAISLPLSHLELRMRRYVPRCDARVILCDAGDGLSERAAQVMEAAGYTYIAVVAGGAPACGEAGMELFRGHYVVTYAFGLYVERHCGTPQISPATLKAKMDAGESLVVLDARPPEDFAADCIPGAIDVPLAELVYRIRDVAPDPATQVVVNCGAITRGMLGGQSLIDAGAPNPVRVLDNGVRGWDLAGLELEQGATRAFGLVSDAARAWALEAAARVAQLANVDRVDWTGLERWRQDASRSLFVVDVRTREEYERGHLEDAIWVPGSEMAGLYEDHIGTLNARVCLVDNDGARATVVASWLTRMGWPDVAVLEGGICEQRLVTGPETIRVPELEKADVDRISVDELAVEREQTLVIDVATSLAYERAHIPGAWWMTRSSLPKRADRIPRAQRYVVTSEDGELAVLAALDLRKLTDTPVVVLAGGTVAWEAAGQDLVSGMIRPLCEVVDALPELTVRPCDDRETALASQRRMVEWHEELLEKLERDDTFSFPPLPLP